jgi:hypothetical protein
VVADAQEWLEEQPADYDEANDRMRTHHLF